MKHMKNQFDGGTALVEAFRQLGVEYILSSPGTEWAPVWEAMADQIHRKKSGPKLLDVWHETLAVDMAMGYTLATGRMQAVLLHAGAGLLQGAMAREDISADIKRKICFENPKRMYPLALQ